ncbi:GRP family sugar transporter, partial [Enterococcus faecalis]|uniref:GRP family sugar transporter n=1 Tax=Enterococcus faecalis TaxID=1351 RepID=UPI003CC5B9D5
MALVPMIAWGCIGLVSGKIGGSANQLTLGMTIGALLFSNDVFFVIQPTLTSASFIVGFI